MAKETWLWRLEWAISLSNILAALNAGVDWLQNWGSLSIRHRAETQGQSAITAAMPKGDLILVCTVTFYTPPQQQLSVWNSETCFATSKRSLFQCEGQRMLTGKARKVFSVFPCVQSLQHRTTPEAARSQLSKSNFNDYVRVLKYSPIMQDLTLVCGETYL